MFLTVVNLFTYRYALVGHILFSTWMYSNPQIFQASGTLGTLLSAAGVDSSATNTLNNVISGLNSQVSILNRFIDVPLHTTVLVLIAVAFVFVQVIFPLIANALMGVLPCLHYCCRPTGTEGGHPNYSTIIGTPIGNQGVHNVHKIVGLDSYYIHDNDIVKVCGRKRG